MAAGCCPVHAFIFAWPRLGCCMSLVDSGYNVLLLRQCLLSPYSGKKKIILWESDLDHNTHCTQQLVTRDSVLWAKHFSWFDLL